MRIYELATTAASASSGDYIAIDSGAAGATERITYASFCLNMPAISTTGSVTAATITATSATITSLDASLARDYAFGYVSASGTVVAPTAASAASAIGGTWTSSTASSDFSVSASGKVTHSGTDSELYYINASLSISRTSATTANATFQLWKSGTAIPGASVERYFSGNDTGTMSVQALTSLGENDYIEVRIYADVGSLDFRTNVGSSIIIHEVT